MQDSLLVQAFDVHLGLTDRSFGHIVNSWQVLVFLLILSVLSIINWNPHANMVIYVFELEQSHYTRLKIVLFKECCHKRWLQSAPWILYFTTMACYKRYILKHHENAYLLPCKPLNVGNCNPEYLNYAGNTLQLSINFPENYNAFT